MAGQAFAWALDKIQVEMQGVAALVVAAKGEADVINAFFDVPVQGFEKIVGPVGREQFLKGAIGEYFLEVIRCHWRLYFC